MHLQKFVFFLLWLSPAALPAFCQDKTGDYWLEKPVPHTIPASLAGQPAVIVEENAVIKYRDEEDKQLWMYKTTHRTVKLLDDQGIEGFNKMTIPVYDGEELLTLKARTILAGGQVIDISKDKMKETKDEDGNRQIVFAMDGVEKNAEVEMMTTYKKPAAFFGKEVYQFSLPVMHATFSLSSPLRLRFEEKGYNGFPTEKDTVINGFRYIYAEKNDIPPITGEAYSFVDVNRMRADYKVSYIPEEKSNVRMFTWQDLAKRLYTNIYNFSDKEERSVEKFLAGAGVLSTDNEEDKIKKIEKAIKGSITLYKQLQDGDAGKLENVISRKSATESGLIRLFAACYTQAGVKHELGISSNRSINRFDPDFENWNIIEHYLIYFPGSKKYLSPASVYYRYPFTNTDVLTNKGVFCKLTTLGGVTSAIADVRTVPPEPTAESHNDIIADISFNDEMEPKLAVTYLCTGYCAMGNRELIVLLPKEKVKEAVQRIASIAEKPENLLDYKIEGEAFDNYSDNKPLVLTTIISAPQLVEKAGAKYLFRLGDVIGRQAELYQNTARRLPIDLEYPHYLDRTIHVDIPSGYKVLNPETIKMQVEYKDAGGKVTAAFYSDCKIEGSKLTVTISEFYSQLHFEVSEYEAFRKVINASADFNKVTLLLAK